MKFLRNLSAALLGLLVAAPCVQAKEAVTPNEATAIATEAYIFGYPLVTMEMTRRVMTNVPEPGGSRAPMGRLVRLREYPNAKFRDVTAPNADTLYTAAWIDVGKEPWVLSIPDAHGRYFLFPMLDGWTNVFQSPGKRTTGTGAQKYAITGPGWKGTLPEGVVEYKAPTNLVWILGRIYCTSTKEDYKAVHEMQDEVSLVPLSSYGKPYTPARLEVDPKIDMKTPVRDQVNSLKATEFFQLLADLMKDNPPAEADAPVVARMAKLGIVPGQKVAFDKLDPAVREAVEATPKSALDKIRADFAHGGSNINGWLFTTKTGLYGTDYLQRAMIAYYGLGANLPQDAVYPTSETDVEGRAYSGENNYVIHIPKGQMPPADGFWSLTMYDGEFFFSENKLNRYTLSARDDLKQEPDGSVKLYLQHASPGADKESNWLPAPAGKFVLMLRLYWPSPADPSILDGTWKPPAVTLTK